MNSIKALIHSFMMVFSSKFRKSAEARKLIAELEEKIRGYGYYPMHNGPGDVRRFIREETGNFRQLIKDVVVAGGPAWRNSAIAALTESNNVVLLGLAVELYPAAGGVCGDKVMNFARRNLCFAGHTDRAAWARSELLLAREWYERSGYLDHATECEIERGLTATHWCGIAA